MTKIDRIKQACRLAIELGEKATPERWRIVDRNGLHILAETTGICTGIVVDKESNIAFIAHFRTFAPAAARALLGEIEWLESNASASLSGPNIFRNRLTAIEASFPDAVDQNHL